MFEASFLANLIIFSLGQAAAWGYLRTGRIRRGVALIVIGWLLADIALLARFAYDGMYQVFWISLVAMQVYSLVEFGLFVFRRARRRSPQLRSRREVLFREAFIHYLNDRFDSAEEIYRRLLKWDPWDVESVLSLAAVHARRGERSKARAAFRSASALDCEDRYTDFIELELERCEP